jgi:ribonuclease HI
MKYHIISTSKSGHGAIFTNQKEAKDYQTNHPGSVYQVLADRLPAKIPAIGKETTAEPVKLPKGPSDSITVYTDGSALNNPGPGGWGFVVQLGADEVEEYSQGYEHTTNNRMEMMAVIEALETLKDFKGGETITIHSDSQYVINGITKGWAKNWRKKGWKFCSSPYNGILNLRRKIIWVQHLVPGRIFKKRELYVFVVLTWLSVEKLLIGNIKDTV